MEEDKFKDLLEDEELTALRLAALATKKKNDQNLNKSECALPINSIVTASTAGSELVSNQIPFVQSDRSSHNNYTWRKQNQSLRRRGGSFPKNHRSNLIVISPVTLNDGKDSEEKVPPLVLPQHKWCNSGNEDSLSPKTLRKTGPTRFNRHGSDSESSDDESDYEPSDNDSGSNETILQDEPPEHFSRLSPACDNLSDSVEKKRRLSFQSLDSDIKSDTFDKNEATSVYKSLKNSLYSDTKQDRYSVQSHLNDGEQTFNNSDNKNYSNCNAAHTYTTKSPDLSEDLVFNQSNASVVRGESCSDKANASLNHLSDSTKMWQDMDAKSNACYSKDPENSRNFRLSDGNQNDYVDKRQSLQAFTDAHGSKNSVWQQNEGFRTDNSRYPVENKCILSDSRTYSDNNAQSHLSNNDLRLELKKRMQEMKSKTTSVESNDRTYSQYDNSWDRSRQRYPHKDDKTSLSSTNTFDETRESSFHQGSRIKQNFRRENDDVEHTSNFNRQRSSRSISRERAIQESSSGRDKNRFESSYDGRRRYNRSSSPDRNRNERSSSRGRRRERSSSRDENRRERSSSQGRIKHNSNAGRSEGNLSSGRNKFEHSYRRNRSNDDNTITEGRRDWYKSSPREKHERSSSQDRSRRDCSSSSDSKHGRSTSRDRNKFSFSNSRNRQDYNADNDKNRHYTQNHDKNLYEKRGRNKHVPDSIHFRNKHKRSSSRDRSRHESSRSLDSRSERSCSPEKSKYSSNREGSKDDHSSSESENKYRCNIRSAFSTSKFTSNRHKNSHNIVVNEKINIKENESNQVLVQEYNSLQSKKLNCNLTSEKIKEESSRKVNIDFSKSIEQNKSERSNSKEKLISNKKSHQREGRMKNSYKNRYSRSRSSSSESCSSSYSSSSSHSYKPKIRSVPSVIKPVIVKSDTENKGNLSENKSVGKSISLITPQSNVHSVCTKRNLDNIEINKPSNIKSGRMDGDSKAPEGKRVPVHMRLGAFPRKRVIQMPKDVEAAFVNSSSSSDGENVNTKCKRQNIRIVTDMYDAKNRIDLMQQKYPSDDKPVKRSSPDNYKEKFKRVKAHR